MKKDSIVVSFLILICGLSLIFVSGCATSQSVKATAVKSDTAVGAKTIKGEASMNDILADETAKSKAGWVAFQKKEAARKTKALAEKEAKEKAAQEAAKIPENADMKDILAEETAKSKAGWVAFQKKEAARKTKALAEKEAQEKTTK